MSENAPYYQAPAAPSKPVKFSAMAIAGIVLGAVALATSFLPIFNNVSFFIGLLGAVFALIGVIAGFRGTRRGKGLAVAALVVSIVACIIVLATQSLYVSAINAASDSFNDAMAGDQAVSSTSAAGEETADAGAQIADFSNLSIGETVNLESGLAVTVTGTSSAQNYDGSPLVCATVSYVNNGSEEAPYNMFDWESQNASGAQTTPTIYGDSTLGSGTLVPGGSVTGEVYFEGDAVKLLYSSNMFADTAAGWNIA